MSLNGKDEQIPAVITEKPLISCKSLIAFYEEITSETVSGPDFRKPRRFYQSLGVLRVINGHPAVFRSEVIDALKSEKTIIGRVRKKM